MSELNQISIQNGECKNFKCNTIKVTSLFYIPFTNASNCTKNYKDTITIALAMKITLLSCERCVIFGFFRWFDIYFLKWFMKTRKKDNKKKLKIKQKVFFSYIVIKCIICIIYILWFNFKESFSEQSYVDTTFVEHYRKE